MKDSKTNNLAWAIGKKDFDMNNTLQDYTFYGLSSTFQIGLLLFSNIFPTISAKQIPSLCNYSSRIYFTSSREKKRYKERSARKVSLIVKFSTKLTRHYKFMTKNIKDVDTVTHHELEIVAHIFLQNLW